MRHDTLFPDISLSRLAASFDHTLLSLDATTESLARLCEEAVEHSFYGVCVYPRHVAFAAARLAGRKVRVVAVAGFPTGLDPTAAKAAEAREAVAAGADEVDMVLNLDALRACDYEAVRADIAAVVLAVAPAPVKVILETAALTTELKAAACALAVSAGAAYVKTSSGFGPGGATAHDVALLRRTVPPAVGVKASGGIKRLDQALTLLAAGADRLGASASAAIMAEAKARLAATGYLGPDPAAIAAVGTNMSDPGAIERASFAMIEAEAGGSPARGRFVPEEWLVVRRMIHATADFELLETAAFGGGGVEAALAGLHAGRRVVTDTRMALCGISGHRLARFGGKSACYMHEPEVIQAARRNGTTRAREAVDLAVAEGPEDIFVIGNAPTALLRLLEHVAAGRARPAFVVGLPVGFVNAAESKELLLASHGVPYLTVRGRKGGSTMAAASVNALADLAAAGL